MYRSYTCGLSDGASLVEGGVFHCCPVKTEQLPCLPGAAHRVSLAEQPSPQPLPAAAQSLSSGGLCHHRVPLRAGARAVQDVWGTIERSQPALPARTDFAYPLRTAGLPLRRSTGWDCARNLVLGFTQFFKTILRLRTIPPEICKIILVLSLDLEAPVSGSYCFSCSSKCCRLPGLATSSGQLPVIFS